LAAAAVVAALPLSARADEKTACVDAHIEGQRLRDAGKLRAARQKFVTCGAQTCPGPVSRECADWLRDVEGMLPTMLVTARDASGQESADVTVRVDGELVLPRLSGMPTPIDPGEHTLRFAWPDGRVREQRLLVTAGEKNRRVAVDYPEALPVATPPPPPPLPPRDSGVRVPAASVALGAVGVLGLGSFTVLGIDALSRAHRLESTCAPACSPEASSTMRREGIVADVSLGVGLVALGAALWIFVSSEHDRSVRASSFTPFPSAAAAGRGARSD
jgi:hypothetical protein